MLTVHQFFFASYGDPRYLHSFPTRRSSDLLRQKRIDEDDVVAGHRGHQLGERVAKGDPLAQPGRRSEEHTSELQSRQYIVCRLLLEKKKFSINMTHFTGNLRRRPSASAIIS